MPRNIKIDVKRHRAALFVVANGLFIAALILGLVRHRRPHYEEVPAQRHRIDQFISVLKKESFEESIEHLSTDGQQYITPGFHSGLKFAQTDLEEMLSSRRSVKVLQGLKKLSTKAREAKCKDMFAGAFQKQTNRWHLNFERRKNPSIPSDNGSTGAPKMGIAVAMFAAAELGQKQLLAEEFSQLDNFKAEMEHLEAEAPWPVKMKYVPDKRFQVNVLRLVASHENRGTNELLVKVDRVCEAADMTTNMIQIVAWNAQTTAFDRLVGSPMDTSKGVTKYQVYAWKTSDLYRMEDKQSDLVKKLRNLVFY